MKEHELDRCKTCGNEPEVVTVFRGGKVHAHAVACKVCPMATPWRPCLEEVAKIWNRRPDPTTPAS